MQFQAVSDFVYSFVFIYILQMLQLKTTGSYDSSV